LIFRVQGANAEVEDFDSYVRRRFDWRQSEVGRKIIEYSISAPKVFQPVILVEPSEENYVGVAQFVPEQFQESSSTIDILD
jgi:hypothetical protein